MNGEVKAVIFDLDGTLIISTVDFLKFRKRLLEFIKGKGANMNDYALRELTVSMISKFESEMRNKGVPEDTIQSYLDDIDDFLNEIEMENIEQTKPVPGAKEILLNLRKKGIKIGILTRGCPAYAEKALTIAGLWGLADAVVSRDRKSGIAPKPSAEAAESLLKKMEVDRDRAVMLGDYSIDYICARNAGIKFYGISSSEESLKNLNDCGCENIVADFDEFRKRIGL